MDGQRYTVDQVIARYVEIRDEREALAERHKAEMAPLNDALDKIEAWLMAQMNAVGTDQFKSQAGTAFRKTTNRVKVEDWDAILQFIQDNHEWTFLTKALAGDAVKQYAAEHGGALPPGVALNTVLSVQVRRA